MTGVATTFRIEGVYLLILALVVLAISEIIRRRVGLLREYSIPAVVVGGLICSAVIAGIQGIGGIKIELGSDLRDMLLLAFFSTVGLTVKLRYLRTDLRALLVLLVLATALLVFQNMVGSAVAAAFGAHPAAGLIAGSISFVGGHGTGVAWGGIFAERFELANADQVALACATFGLVLGGVVGGPLARRLIKTHDLSSETSAETYEPLAGDSHKETQATATAMLTVILLIAICIGTAKAAVPWLQSLGLTLPGFVVALFVGAVLTNLMDELSLDLNIDAVGLVSDVTLQIFLAIGISSIQLLQLTAVVGPLLAVLILQVILVVVFTYFIVFPTLGRDYDASVVCAGFAGFSLGATPVGLASMRAITRKFGASPKAFLVVPLVGGFLIDIVNTFVIQLYLASPVLD